MSEPATVTASAQPRRQSASREAGLRRRSLAPIGGGHLGLLDASIRRISSVLSEPSPEHWAIRTPGMRRIASVDLSAGWLSLSMSLRQLKLPINLKIIGSMLSRNARMDGSCRIVAQRQHGRRQIVADLPAEILPWDCETGLDTLIGGTIAGLDAAVSPNAQHGSPISEAGLPREPVSHEQMEAMFDEAGWPAQPGEDERLEIPLEVPGTYHSASVEHDSASICLSVPILPVELAAAPRLCRDAVTVLLWFTSSRLRMVKATRSRRV